MKRLAIFCGSSIGNEIVYKTEVKRLGEVLANQNIGLVYGGANVGLMGIIADSILESGGEAIGVLPHFLASKEIAHENLTELILVKSMHERKTKMDELSDGVIALPGGFGTLEEFFEMLTWAQLGLHSKPIGILNIDGFYDDLISLVQNMVSRGFVSKINQKMILLSNEPKELIEKMQNHVAPQVGKWIDKDKT